MYMYACVCMYVCMCVCMYVCMYVCVREFTDACQIGVKTRFDRFARFAPFVALDLNYHIKTSPLFTDAFFGLHHHFDYLLFDRLFLGCLFFGLAGELDR